jgi:hypothetical protein
MFSSEERYVDRKNGTPVVPQLPYRELQLHLCLKQRLLTSAREEPSHSQTMAAIRM